MKRKRNEAAIENAPEKVFETNSFLVILDLAIMAITTQFKQMEGFSNNFNFLYDVK
jgi:hypothetical protein